MHKKNAILATAAAAAVALGTVSPGVAAPPAAPTVDATNQQAQVLDVTGGEYVVMLELPTIDSKMPKGMASAAGKNAVASTTQKQVDKWQSKGV